MLSRGAGTVPASHPGMRGMMTSLLSVAVMVLVVWFVAQAAGYRMSLLSSLALSVGLTLVLNLAMRGFRRRRYQH